MNNDFENNLENNNGNSIENNSKITVDAKIISEISEEGSIDNRNKTSSKKGNGSKDNPRLQTFMKIASTALVFGLVAGVTFQGFNYASNRLISESQLNNAQLVVSNNNQTPSNLSKDPIAVTTNTGGSEDNSDISTVVDNVMPSIVSISITTTQNVNDIFGRTYSNKATGSGSGIIIGQNSKQVLIATNNHVVEGADTVSITFADDTTATAMVKGTEASSDLAVVAVNIEELSQDTRNNIKVATLGDSETLKVGEMAIAIGNALGYGQSVTVGYVSALEREVSIEDSSMKLLQTDAAINPGNSGGALLNSKGEVIGINSVKYASAEVEGMGYAIPISDAIPIITELMNKETIPESEQAYLGIMGQDITSNYAESFRMPIGVYVGEVSENSPAQKAGLNPGSIITRLNEKDATTMERLQEILAGTRAGEPATLTIKVLENGNYIEKTLSLTLGSKSDAK